MTDTKFSRIITGDETYTPYFDVSIREESRVWTEVDEEIPTKTKNSGRWIRNLCKILQEHGEKTDTAKRYTS